MSTTDDYDSSQESTLRPMESTIMKSQWDLINTNDGARPSKYSRDWVDENEAEEETSVGSTIYNRTMFDESQQLTKIQNYVSTVARRDKLRMDHEIKATSPTKVPNDKMGSYLYGCSSKEVMSGDVDRGCMLSCLQGYRTEDVDSCNHDVYVLEDSLLRKVHTAPTKTRSETSYIYTVLLDTKLVKEKLAKIAATPLNYKVFSTNTAGSEARLLFEIIPFSDISTPKGSRDIVTTDFVIQEENGESCSPPPPPPSSSAMVWTWILIIIVAILAIAGIIWLVSYFMRQQRMKDPVVVTTPVVVTAAPEVVVTETSTTIITTSESDLWGSPPSTGPRKPHSY